MTCKRYKSLSCSDSLWEALCEREWGLKTVDVLKSCSLPQSDGFSWMMMFRRVCQMDSVCCHRISDLEDDEKEEKSCSFPVPRASHSLNFVNDHLVLFGGGCQGGRHLDDTWTAYVDKSSCNLLKWRKVESGTPSGRFGHTCVVIGEYILLFGGINDRGERLNDTWIGQVSCHERLCWKLLDVGPLQRPRPPPRGAHSACCIAEKKMVVHGGIGLNGVRLGDTWILIYGGEDSYRHRKDDFWALDVKTIPSSGLQPQGVCLNGSTVWKKLNRISYGPKSRSFHRACADSSGRYVYVFGGMVDGLLQPAASSGLRFDGELFMVELVLGFSDLDNQQRLVKSI